MAGAVAVPRNEMLDVADLLTKVVPLFVGTKKNTSEVTQGSIDPLVMAQGNDLLSTLQQRGSTTTASDQVVQDILYRAQLAFAPVLGQEKGAGLYNSQTKKMLGNESIARATAAASEAVLKNQTDALGQATSLVNARTSATRSSTTSGSTKTPPSINPVTTLASLGGAFAYNKLKKKVAESQAEKQARDAAIKNSIYNGVPGEEGPPAETVANQLFSSGDLQVGTEAVTNTAGSLISDAPASDISSLIGNFTGYAPDTLTSSIANSLISSGSDVGLESLGAGAVGEASLDAGLLSGVGATTLDWAGPAVATDILGAGVVEGGVAAAGEGLALEEIATTAALAWVVCTELKDQGKLRKDTYCKAAPDFLMRMRLKPSAVRGYHFWAIPYVRIMKRKDWIGSLAVALIRPFAVGRANHINGKKNFLGWFSFSILEPICSLLGNTIARKPWHRA